MNLQKSNYSESEKIKGGVTINPIIEQTLYYGIVMFITIFLIGILQKGFFFNFVRVKLSFGRLILVKLRAVNRDYYSVGRIEEGFLTFSTKVGKKRVSIPDSSVFYRSLGVTWIDIEDQKNAIGKPDYTAVEGFDGAKFNNLYVRTLYRPNITDNKTKIIIGALILIMVLVIAVGFAVYKQNYLIETLGQQVNSVKGVIAGGNV